jgi:hypothetical protein
VTWTKKTASSAARYTSWEMKATASGRCTWGPGARAHDGLAKCGQGSRVEGRTRSGQFQSGGGSLVHDHCLRTPCAPHPQPRPSHTHACTTTPPSPQTHLHHSRSLLRGHQHHALPLCTLHQHTTLGGDHHELSYLVVPDGGAGEAEGSCRLGRHRVHMRALPGQAWRNAKLAARLQRHSRVMLCLPSAGPAPTRCS